MKTKSAANTGLAKVAVQCSADTFVVNQGLVLRINICGENRHLRQARNRYAQVLRTLHMNHILKLIIFLFFFSCTNDKENKGKEKASNKHIKTETQAPTCTVTEKQNPEVTDPIIIQTCVWGQYKFITTGSPDYKGRYSYEYEVYRITNDKDIKIQNKDIFNSKVSDLEKLINAEIAKELKENRQYPENAECLSDVRDPNFSINDMGITIDQKGRMKFNVTFGLGGACFNADGASAKFSPKEINVYLK